MARSHRRQAQSAPQRLILDSGAVIALSRGESRARAVLTLALELGLDVRIPVAVLEETLRGNPRDAPVHRIRNTVDVFPTEETAARLAGALLGRTGGTNTVDALVTAEAIITSADVLTSDARDLRALLGDHRGVTIVQI